MREGEAVQKSGGGKVGNRPAFSEQRHRGKKTFPLKVVDLPGLNFAHVCTWVLTMGESLQSVQERAGKGKPWLRRSWHHLCP